MEQFNKGKPVTTSVPTISIKFHANAEQLEELYASDDEHTNDTTTAPTGAAGVSEPESSPLKLLPRLVKRSTSIDITPNPNIDASPPSDPWRFFSDIKGKITKSVEDKITEIKSRNHEEGSPLRTSKVKDSKENSSLSDSEDLSESSISKTCGIFSTTEGAEMSSDDDDTPSIEKDRNVGLRQRFRLLKSKTGGAREGTISRKNLASIYSINNDKIEQALPEENDIESAVDALEEIGANFKILKEIEHDFDNIKIDEENVVNIKEVSGDEMKEKSIVYAPVGFVDLRGRNTIEGKKNISTKGFHFIAVLFFYVLIHSYSSYLAGFLIGVFVTCVFYYVKILLETPAKSPPIAVPTSRDILQIPAVKEFQPLTKYEGWVNEFPDNYNPHTYHISQTQSVFLRLQGNLLRLSHTKSKVAKRALWNEPKIKPIFTHHRVYNLSGAQVELLPVGLAKKRHWSKKYPICVTLNKDQMDFVESPIEKKRNQGSKKKFSILAQRFSKLTEEENEDFEGDSENSRASSPSPLSPDDSDDKLLNEALDDALKDEENEGLLDDEFDSIPDDWSALTPPDESPTQTKLFLFGRTDREKEDWFRRLKAATHKGGNLPSSDTSEVLTETDYIKYMMIFNKIKVESDVQWINSLVGRVFFDCLRDENFTQGLKDKIQSKLSSIKLPYFIEGLMVTELNLGKTPPVIHKATKPNLDERGLWIDLDVTYEGLVVLILQTKLNLMKLKQPHSNETTKERSAMFNSDVEDSPESTSDEETPIFPNPPTLESGNTSKKFIKMVDRIAESKFFQAATEYRYIKKAMEGVSNTDLRLKVEIKELVGTLVLNIPSPPSDRIWIGFRPTPELALGAQPIVGERNITFLRITSWIEKKLRLEFQKLLVIPNMEDFIVPVMTPKLPE
ncbi:testis-expressed protein 2 isoform X2 [Tribolium madens]|uniref:testis-expressed protein 2 isoform X2 n=1 Tax=Tribolium madens TaxID=41895 RepID=UPI001CF75DCD|nr:testis-expressed protein 2 isoform X2 [Tribolium madens]